MRLFKVMQSYANCYAKSCFGPIDPEQQAHAVAMRTLPSPSSYAGVLLGLLPPPSPDAATAVVPSIPSPAKPKQTKHTLPQMTSEPTSSPSPLKPSFVPIHAPQRRSHRLANQAELAGGRKVYSHSQAPRTPPTHCFQLRPAVSGEY